MQQLEQLEHAARALAWDGYVIPNVEVLGSRFAAVARLLPDVHQWRADNGWNPEPSPLWFRSWSDPDLHDHLPVAAVDLLGVLVPVNKARKALQACGSLMTLAPCTVVLPSNHEYKPWPTIELDYYGIGVVTADAAGKAQLVLAPEDRTAEFGSSLFGRWLLELLYSRVLERQTEITGNAAF